MNGLARVRQALKDRRSLGEVIFLQTDGDTEFLGKIRMVLFFVHLIEEIFEKIGVVAIFHHAESEASQRHVVQVVLQRPALQYFHRNFAATQLREVRQLH